MNSLPFQKYHLGQCLISCDDMSLSYANKTVNLPVKVFEFLKLLIVYPQQTVTKEMVIEEVWQGNVEVGKRGAGNAIWALRKAFTELGLDHEQTFKTITKVGYQLLIKPIGVHEEITKTSNQVIPAEQNNRRKKVIFAILILMTITVLFSLIEDVAPPKVEINKQVQKITNLEGIEEQPSITADGHYMAFLWRAHLKKNQIYIKNLTRDEPLRLVSMTNTDQSSPSWSSDGQKLAYLNVDDNGLCTVHIHELITNIDTKIASECVKKGYLKSLDWSNDGLKIAFSRSLEDRIAVFSYNIATNKETQLTFPQSSEEDLLMRWHVNSQSLAFVRSTDAHSEIRLTGNETEQVIVKDKEMILALTWDNKSENIYFNSLEKGNFAIAKYNLLSKNMEQFHQDFGTHNLAVNPVNNELFYTRHVGQESISIRSLDDGKLLKNLQSSSRDLFGQITATKNDIMFLSNRSGNWEVWLKRKDQNIQLTQSEIHGLVSIPAISPIEDKFVIAMRRPSEQKYGLYVGEIPSGKQTKLLDMDADVRNPSFSADGKRVYFSANIEGKWAIYRYTFATEQIELVAQNSGKYAVEDDNGGLFFTKDNTRGIFYFSADKRETLITTELSDLDWGSLYYKNKTLYYLKRTEKADFIIARDSDGVEVEVMEFPPVTIRNYKGISPGINNSIVLTLQGINDSDIYKISTN